MKKTEYIELQKNTPKTITAKKVTNGPCKEDGDLKADMGKLRYDLIPIEAVEGIAQIFTYGSMKYDDNNWKKSKYPERYYAAMMRHLAAWRKGEIIDPESKLLHIDHALTCLVMYRELQRKQELFKQI